LSSGNRPLAGGQLSLKLSGMGISSPNLVRVLNSLLGVLDWVCIIFAIVGAIAVPRLVITVAAFVGAYLAGRTLLALYANVLGLRIIRRWEAVDWRAEYEKRRASDSLLWESVLHVVLLPNYNEELIVLRQTLDKLALSPLAQTQVAVVLAMEAREPGATAKAAALQAEYAPKFWRVLATFHPADLPGEAKVKSANETWAAREAKRILIEDKTFAFDHVLVTASDADTQLDPQYLSCLTCLFATDPDRHRRIWQAPVYYHNNVWESHPAFGMVYAYSAAWELAFVAGRWWRTLPISTYSLSLALIDGTGYWDTNVIPDESHMFLKCFYRCAGQLTVERVFLPFSSHAVAGDNFWDSCKNRYSQTLRHGWGATDITYAILQAIAHPEVPARLRLSVALRIAHDHVTAGAGWILITLGAQLPILLHPSLLSEVWHFWPFIALQVALAVIAVATITFWIFDMRRRPPRPYPLTGREILTTAFSFVLLPVLTVIFLGLPVIEAQTRMMLGIPLGFKVARKV